MKKNLHKQSFLVLLLLLSALPIFALERPFFNGYMGANGDLFSVSNDEDEDNSFGGLGFGLQSYFSGQLDFSGIVFVRGEFYFQTGDLNKLGGFLTNPNDYNTRFKIQEFSATYHRVGLNLTHFLSIFLGEYESIGSDVFLQRQFGMAPISSKLTTSWHGLNGAAVYPFYGIGASYILHFQKPFATGVYGYYSLDKKAIQFDARFACTFANFTFDAALGPKLNMSQTDSAGIAVILVINEMDIHGGFNMLFGNKNQNSLFLQFGGDLNINPSSTGVFSVNTPYFLIEPRFILKQSELDFSVFHFPKTAIYDMTYLESLYDTTEIGVTGLDVCFSFDKLLFKKQIAVTMGVHLTGVLVDIWEINLKSGANFNSENFIPHIMLTPYASLPLMGGTLTSSLNVNFSISEQPIEWDKFLTFSLGYVMQL